MNQYEIAVVFDPGLEVDMSKPTAKLEKIIAGNGGKIVSSDNWGKRKLAYPIAGNEHGLYVIYKVELPAENVAKVDTTLNITDEVIRHLLTRPDLKAIAKAEELKAEKAKKNPGGDERKDNDDDEDNDRKDRR